MVLQEFWFALQVSDRHPWATEYSKTRWFCNNFALIRRPLTNNPVQQNTRNTMVSQQFRIDPKASDRHPRATEYCRTQWFCNLLYFIQFSSLMESMHILLNFGPSIFIDFGPWSPKWSANGPPMAPPKAPPTSFREGCHFQCPNGLSISCLCDGFATPVH